MMREGVRKRQYIIVGASFVLLRPVGFFSSKVSGLGATHYVSPDGTARNVYVRLGLVFSSHS